MTTKHGYWVAAGIVVATAVAWLAFGGLGENLVYYWSPSELHQAGDQAHTAVVRLGGQVKAGSIKWSKDENRLRFVVTDGTADVDVMAQAVPPQMFREGIGVVIEGQLDRNGIFRSDRLLVKHSNEYQAPKKGGSRTTKDLMKTVLPKEQTR